MKIIKLIGEFFMIIAIDGTTGSGKSTISKLLAQKLGFTYVRTGSFYRALALKIKQSGTDYTNRQALQEMLKTTTITYQTSPTGHVIITLDGVDVSGQLNSPEISAFVAKVSPIKTLRAYVRKLQQESADFSKNIVMEGRDIGSVVFPNAEVKVFIDCDIKERARRRAAQYAQSGKIISESQAKADILERDRLDTERENSPLVVSPGSLVLDTTNLSIDQCVDKIIEFAKIK
jgi:cytidylate kinase